MKYNLQTSAHAVFSLHYHLVLVVKYRRKVFISEEMIDELKRRTRSIAERFGAVVLGQGTDLDRTHILFTARPSTNLTKLINALKGATSRVIWNRFPEVRRRLWRNQFWSGSYCLITRGEVTLDVLKQYVGNQGK